MFEEDVKYAVKRLEKLVGWQIVGTVSTPDDTSYGFVVQRDSHGTAIQKKVCWVDCDPEGNGPGWIQIEEMRNEQSNV